MNMNQDYVVAVAIGFVVGLIGALVFGRLKTLVARATAAKQQEPALVKVKRSYKRKVTADESAVTAITSSNASKKNRGRITGAKATTKKIRSTAEVDDATKKRRGRPTDTD